LAFFGRRFQPSRGRRLFGGVLRTEARTLFLAVKEFGIRDLAVHDCLL